MALSCSVSRKEVSSVCVGVKFSKQMANSHRYFTRPDVNRTKRKWQGGGIEIKKNNPKGRTNIILSFAVSAKFTTEAIAAINLFFFFKSSMSTCFLVLDSNTDTEIK